jgi:hypothetical protein
MNQPKFPNFSSVVQAIQNSKKNEEPFLRMLKNILYIFCLIQVSHTDCVLQASMALIRALEVTNSKEQSIKEELEGLFAEKALLGIMLAICPTLEY